MSCFLKYSLRTWLLVGLAALLTACGSVMDTDKVNYKSETEEKAVPLEVPPDLSKISRSKRYDMPGGSISAKSLMNESNQSTETDASSTSPLKLADIEIKREGSQMWLQVARPPEVLWPLVKDFWKDSGFALAKEEQAVGLIETDWAENRAKLPQDFVRRNLGKLLDALYSTGERDKFRIRLDRTNDNKTEIFITHRGLIETGGTRTNAAVVWQPRPNDPELEKEFMRRLMVKLAPTTPTPTVNGLALDLPPLNSASEVVAVDGKPSVRFKQGFDVTWRRVGQALDRNGFTVEDRDRSQGLYFVRYIETNTEEEPGFFSKLFSKSKPQQGPQQYRLKITNIDAQSTAIAILNSAGEPDGSATATRIAKLLVNELK
jgi:outer membrane protein assembly factor BamC